VVGVEQWAEIRRMHRVERLSIREIHRRTGLHRKTIRRALASEGPPAYRRAAAGSKLDPFKGWVEEQLRVDPRLPSKRLRELAEELGYEGGKTIFDDWVREVRPRYLVRRTYQRTVYRPGELCQFDLWEPREPVPVGHGQLRRGFVVTAELCWSRALAGALVFSKQWPDLAWGMSRCLRRLGALPGKLVWDREGAIHAGGGRPTAEFAAFCGQLGVGWIILDPGDAEAKGVLERSHRFLRTNFEPGRLRQRGGLPGPARRLGRQGQRPHPPHGAGGAGRAARSGAGADAAAARPAARHRPAVCGARGPAALSAP
jgi:transposase